MSQVDSTLLRRRVGRLLFLAAAFVAALSAPAVARAQGPLTNGENHAGSISAPGEVDEWTFVAYQGDSVIITLVDTAAAPGNPEFWPWLRVTGPGGATLVCGNCWDDLATQMAAVTPLSGLYTVQVASNVYHASATGDYVLRLAKSPGSFEVPNGDQGGAMTNGANHAGRIEPADLDIWTFNADQGDAILLTLAEVPVGPSEPDPGFWPWLRVFSPTGATLVCGNCWDDLATQMAAAAPLTGTYTVVVSSNVYHAAAAGDYVLRLAKVPGTFQVPAGDDGGAMTNAISYNGRIESADLDMWTFTAIQGSPITVRVDEIPVPPTEPDPGFWPWIRVYGPTGATVVCGNCWGDTTAQMSTNAPVTGVYTVVVASNVYHSAASGNYQIIATGVFTPLVPTTIGDTFGTTTHTALNVPAPGVLANDSSHGVGVMTADLILTVSSGSLSLSANGSLSYTPNTGFVGTDTFTYRAVSSAGPGNPATVTIHVDATPLPPTELYASAISGNTVTLRWTTPAGGMLPTNYVLEGGVNPGEVLASIPTGSTDPIYTFTAPTSAFHVRMHTLSGPTRSVASNEIRIFVNVPAPPSAPASLTAMANGSSIALAWRNTFAGGAPGGIVLDVSGSLNTSLSLGLTDNFQFNAVPGGTYTLALRAINAAGSSPSSNAIALTFPSTCTGAPLPPAGFLAYRVGNTLFVLWDPATTGPAPTSFVLNVSGGFTGSFATPGRRLSGAVGSGTYNLSVAAVNACGASAATPVQTVVVP